MKSEEQPEDGSTKSHDGPVTISAPPAAAITIDPQNPLPEPSFFHRRVIAYLVVIACLALMWFAADAFHDLNAAAELLTLSKWIIGFAALIATYYYVAPSAAELMQILQSARIIKSSINIAGNAAGDANAAKESRLDRAETRAERRFQESTARDSRFSEEALSGRYSDEEDDAAPTARTRT